MCIRYLEAEVEAGVHGGAVRGVVVVCVGGIVSAQVFHHFASSGHQPFGKLTSFNLNRDQNVVSSPPPLPSPPPYLQVTNPLCYIFMAGGPFTGEGNCLTYSAEEGLTTIVEVGRVSDHHLEAVHLCKGGERGGGGGDLVINQGRGERALE